MITELLTGEVSVRWHSVAVYFSMDEWEYLEGHKDLYKDIMENHQTITLLDITETEEIPERSHNTVPFSEFLTDDDRNVQTAQCRTDEAAMIKSLENVIEDPASCEESCITNFNMYTPTHHLEKYPSHHTKDTLFPGEQVILMNANISSPTHHIPQDASINIKEESLSCDVETFSDSDAYSPIDHIQYSPSGKKKTMPCVNMLVFRQASHKL
ncbi:oocyte zinc finger protein XlCOF7.1-like [Bufo gargarizans]|uniref:oocyte zinc finger protein XlCOF7.1-like n=1 Tax=Bufo gargarizans TaxID=30331 RepID=UPI001CF21A19|nr:oocyte zinc finger protein XlCOF7.1-like [Bufo gargarizans]